MEKCVFISAVCKYHIYQDAWKPSNAEMEDYYGRRKLSGKKQNLAGKFCVVAGEFSDLQCLMNTLATITKLHCIRSHQMQKNLSLNEGFDNSMARHAPFLSCKWKNSSHEYPKTYGGRDYLSTWSTYPYVLGHSCHEFFHLHDKNGGCRASIFRHQGQIQMGTVPKKCCVNRA